jgi:hypothetical protein
MNTIYNLEIKIPPALGCDGLEWRSEGGGLQRILCLSEASFKCVAEPGAQQSRSNPQPVVFTTPFVDTKGVKKNVAPLLSEQNGKEIIILVPFFE